MPNPPLCVPAPERVALAIDALCVGTTVPLLLHAEEDPTTSRDTAPWALCCTPLSDLTTLADTVAVLGAVSVPDGWRLAGLCAPTLLGVPSATNGGTHRLDAWIIHVVAASGAKASRLCVPDALDLSGPTSAIDTEHPLHRCLYRLVQR